MVLLAAAVFATLSADTIRLNIDGQERDALVFPGDAAAGSPQPVVFAFHGHGGTGPWAARSYDIQSQWPNAIVVYPTGLPTKGRLVDPEGKHNGWDVKPNADNRDIKFFDALYDAVMQKYHGDPNRVFAMGHSNGGYFIYTLWAMRPDRFAGFGSFEAAGARMAKTPKPLFVTIGSQDQVVPPRLQQVSLRAVFRLDGSAGNGQSYGPKGTLYPGAQPVVFWSYDGGHKFPADAVPTMIQFFKSLRLP